MRDGVARGVDVTPDAVRVRVAVALALGRSVGVRVGVAVPVGRGVNVGGTGPGPTRMQKGRDRPERAQRVPHLHSDERLALGKLQRPLHPETVLHLGRRFDEVRRAEAVDGAGGAVRGGDREVAPQVVQRGAHRRRGSEGRRIDARHARIVAHDDAAVAERRRTQHLQIGTGCGGAAREDGRPRRPAPRSSTAFHDQPETRAAVAEVHGGPVQVPQRGERDAVRSNQADEGDARTLGDALHQRGGVGGGDGAVGVGVGAGTALVRCDEELARQRGQVGAVGDAVAVGVAGNLCGGGCHPERQDEREARPSIRLP